MTDNKSLKNNQDFGFAQKIDADANPRSRAQNVLYGPNLELDIDEQLNEQKIDHPRYQFANQEKLFSPDDAVLDSSEDGVIETAQVDEPDNDVLVEEKEQNDSDAVPSPGGQKTQPTPLTVVEKGAMRKKARADLSKKVELETLEKIEAAKAPLSIKEAVEDKYIDLDDIQPLAYERLMTSPIQSHFQGNQTGKVVFATTSDEFFKYSLESTRNMVENDPKLKAMYEAESPEKAKEALEKVARQSAARSAGFWDPTTQTSYVNASVTGMSTVIHELIHHHSSNAKYLDVNRFLREGLTEYYARLVCDHHGIKYGTAYDVEVNFANHLIGKTSLTDALIEDYYFGGNETALKNVMGAEMYTLWWESSKAENIGEAMDAISTLP